MRSRLKGRGVWGGGVGVGYWMGCRVIPDLLRGIQESCGLVGRVGMSSIFFVKIHYIYVNFLEIMKKRIF